MNKYNLIEKFFTSQEQITKFYVRLGVLKIANPDATCVASLEKKGAYWVYTLEHLPSGKYLGDNIKPFKPSFENYNKFNNGCKELAKMLEMYIDADDLSVVSMDAKPFSDLTFDANNG
ncbi:hypothetical protein R5P06_03470 [Candidatus Thioglobus autotrophicus]|uniref:hypothetical protein n=1 Tax=Candidatus Thioglobus autotrophicus TaxID=1705394 RepID=UPI00299ED93B|nr:hypothetical protein [Candidatus Thioglobus autotrophicus]WPE17132.1 hypothetical protein R5P06_03470 [Candidatus Thioglobus autotrophicus]